jgi:hypothetical protein
MTSVCRPEATVHSRTGRSSPAAASSSPSGLNATDSVATVRPATRTGEPEPEPEPEARSWICTVRSALQEASKRPSGLNASERTRPV